MNLNLKYLLLTVMGMLLLSCEIEETEQYKGSTDAISFAICSVTDTIGIELTNQFAKQSATTKGTPVTNENMISEGNGKIAVDAFYKDQHFINDVLVFGNNGNATTSKSSYWPVDKEAIVDFWSYHPHDINNDGANFKIINKENSPSLSFHYTQKRKDTDNLLIDVSEQKDLFVAHAKQGQEQGAVKLQYFHALSAVRFTAGKTLAGKITRITITNLNGGGTFTFNPNGETDKLQWKLDENKYTLDQNFADVNIDENLSGDYTQEITSDINNTTFLLMPQTLKDNQLTIKYIRDGETEPTTYSTAIPEGTWEAGKAYKYTITLMDGLSIEATPGTVESKSINGMVITNIYDKPCYVRAMIMGNWIDEVGQIAALFNPEEVNLKITRGNSNFQLDPNWDTYWFHDEQRNIYYYRKPLHINQRTEVSLFDKFTNPVNHPDGLKLDFTVHIQAIEAESNKASVKEAWGDEISGQLE